MAWVARMYFHRVELEALKLLVGVAWADHMIEPEETEYVLELARQIGASEHEIDLLRASLLDIGRLPGPNLHLLREHQADVLRAVDQLIAIDHRIVADERMVRDAVARILERA